MSDKIETGHTNGRFYVRQGPHQASISFTGNIVRDGALYRFVEAAAIAALIRAKQAQQQLRRPPAPDSRPRRCHAKHKGENMLCRPCRMKWLARDVEYPRCGGDQP